MQKDVIDNDPLADSEESRHVSWSVGVGVRVPLREAETTEEQI
ncbi:MULTISPECIES: hypothetical protein [Streptomyces]|nr:MULTISPECIES: hypothetical protein [Streptomyces]